MLTGRERAAQNEDRSQERDARRGPNGEGDLAYIAPSASFTRMLVTEGKLRAVARSRADSREESPSFTKVSVASSPKGAPAKLFGENTSTKLIP
jgi:hypothetical protein